MNQSLSRLLGTADAGHCPSSPAERQRRVGEWVETCFADGVPAALRAQERALRTLEESIELAQSEDVDVAQIMRLIEYVYSRPRGEPAQELGGVRVALLAYAAEKGLSADAAERDEVERILAKRPEDVRKRNLEKAAAGVAFYHSPDGESA